MAQGYCRISFRSAASSDLSRKQEEVGSRLFLGGRYVLLLKISAGSRIADVGCGLLKLLISALAATGRKSVRVQILRDFRIRSCDKLNKVNCRELGWFSRLLLVLHVRVFNLLLY